MNILITGIHGFIGSNFIRALRDKHALYGLDIIFPFRDGVMSLFILPERPMIRRISQQHRNILISIPVLPKRSLISFWNHLPRNSFSLVR